MANEPVSSVGIVDPNPHSMDRARPLEKINGNLRPWVWSDALERVAKRDSSPYGLRAMVMDKSWEGVGEGNDRWGHQGER